MSVLLHPRYSEKIFAKATDSTVAVDPKTRYSKKKQHMESCGTLGSKVCHDDRVFGSAIARLMGVESSELSQLGFWEMDVKAQSYTKIYLPDTAAKLSGFGQAKDFFIERASFDPEDATDPEVKAFVSAIFSQIDDPEVIEKVRKVSFIVFKMIVHFHLSTITSLVYHLNFCHLS